MGDAEGAGQAQPPALLRQGPRDRAARRAHGALRLRQRDAGPRAAADPGADAHPLEGLLHFDGLRGDDADAPARQRPLSHRKRGCGPRHRLPPRSRLLGQAPADQPRAAQFRPHLLRLLSRRRSDDGGLPGRRIRPAPGALGGPLGDRLRLPGGGGRPRHARAAAARAPLRHVRPGLQHPPRGLRRTRGPLRALTRLRLRVGQQGAAARRLCADAQHLRQLRARQQRPAAGRRAGPAGASRQPAPGRAVRERLPRACAGGWAPQESGGGQAPAGRSRMGRRGRARSGARRTACRSRSRSCW